MSPVFKEGIKDIGVILITFISVLIFISATTWLIDTLLKAPVWVSGSIAQLAFLGSSLILIRFSGRKWRTLGLFLSTQDLARASLASASLAIAVVYIISLIPMEGGTQPELVEDPFLLAILTLLIAPPCEEIFFRGFLQGYMMDKGHQELSIILPAILFSAMHVIPFRSTGLAMMSAILAGALALGLIAGYFRASTGSLMPAVLSHFLFNLVGYVAMMIS